MKKLRILLADDHALVRRGARGLLQDHSGWRVVGEAASGTEAVEMAKKLEPDVAIVDIGLPEMDGVQVTRQIRDALPNTKVLVLTMHDSDEVVQSALGADLAILAEHAGERLAPEAILRANKDARFGPMVGSAISIRAIHGAGTLRVPVGDGTAPSVAIRERVPIAFGADRRPEALLYLQTPPRGWAHDGIPPHP